MLLVSRSGLVEEDAVEVFHYSGFCFFLDVKLPSLFRGNNNVVIVLFPFHIFMPLANCSSSAFKDSFPSQGQEIALTSTYSSTLQKGLWHLLEGESLSWNSPTLAIYGVHSLPLGDAGRDFPFTEDET